MNTRPLSSASPSYSVNNPVNAEQPSCSHWNTITRSIRLEQQFDIVQAESTSKGIQENAIFKSPFDLLLLQVDRLNYLATLSPHCTPLKKSHTRKIIDLQQQMFRKFTHEKSLYGKVLQYAFLLEDLTSQLHSLHCHSTESERQALLARIHTTQQHLSRYTLKYERKIQKHNSQLQYFQYQYSHLVNKLVKKGTISTEMAHGLLQQNSTQSTTAEHLLPPYKMVVKGRSAEQKNKTQEQLLRKERYTLPQHETPLPPSYEDSKRFGPPSYFIHHETAL